MGVKRGLDVPPEVPEFFLVMSEDWTVVEVGTDQAALIGYTPEEMIGTDAWAYVAEPSPRRRPHYTGQLAARGETGGYCDLIHRDGGLIPYVYITRQEVRDGRRVIVSAGVPMPVQASEQFDRWDALFARIEDIMASALDDFLTPAAAARRSSMSTDTLSRWADAGLINRYGPKGTRGLRYRWLEVVRAMALVRE